MKAEPHFFFETTDGKRGLRTQTLIKSSC